MATVIDLIDDALDDVRAARAALAAGDLGASDVAVADRIEDLARAVDHLASLLQAVRGSP